MGRLLDSITFDVYTPACHSQWKMAAQVIQARVVLVTFLVIFFA